ncbi:MAG TPA: GNAT family N-acetyltransferase [Methylomirabilota bacterium]|nr:GNAT family N-acetyltransferase [Methylomirabilota bacterium]
MTPTAAHVEAEPASDLDIRRAAPDDAKTVRSLIARTYVGDAAIRHAWLYEGNPHGRALTWLARDRASGAVMGGTSLFPRRVLVDGRLRIGAIGGDCFIDPAYRRRGVATALHRRCFAEMADAGVAFMYGPPFEANLHALVKAGSRPVTTYRRWARPLTGSSAYRAAFSRAPSRVSAGLAALPIAALDWWHRGDPLGLTLEPIVEFGAEFDRLFERAAAAHRIVCVRDRAYLAWRHLSSPVSRQTMLAVRSRGSLLGLVGLEQLNGTAAIVDFFIAAEPAVIDATLGALARTARAAGCDTLEGHFMQGCVVSHRLRRFGFVPRPGRWFQVSVATSDPQRATLLDPTAWHFTESDQDLDSTFTGR